MKTDITEHLSLISKEKLIVETERLVHIEGMGYAEAVVHVCESRGIDPEDIATLISGSLKEKIKAEAQRNHYLPKPQSLFDL
jgi:hypothetical protein